MFKSKSSSSSSSTQVHKNIKSHLRQPSTDTFVIEEGRISDESLDEDADEDSSSQQKEVQGEKQEQDMRWCLTDEEKASVRELREAADAEGLYYKNIFELAKYVLVVKSIADKTEAKYCDVALRRLRKRDAWLQEHDNLQDVDAVAAHQEISQDVCPEHFDQRFARDGEHQRTVVTTHMAHVPLSYIQQRGGENKRRYLAAAMYRMDLGAVDMEEARRGMVLASISAGQLTLGRAWKYMRFMNSISADMKDMHPHTVKAVHAQFPSFVAHMLPAVKHVLPRKVADRIHVYGSVEQMAKQLDTANEDIDNGNGTATTPTPVEWARRRQELYDETVAKLSLD